MPGHRDEIKRKKKKMGGHGFTCRMDTVGMRMKCKQKGGKRGGGGRLCSLFLRRRLLSDSILTGVLCVSLLAQTLPTALGKRSFGEGFVGWVYY